MFIFIVLFFIGATIFLFSMFDSNAFVKLYYDRNFYCIEKFRTKTKVTDVISVLQNFSNIGVGVFLMFFSLGKIVGFENVNAEIITILYFIGVTVWLIATTVELILIFKHKLRDELHSIKEQWRKQKVVTKENDHEVNLYRGCKRALFQTPKQMVINAVILFVFAFFI